MKYFLATVLLFLVSTPVFAAKSVPGTVPDLPPLQPMPEGGQVNYPGNIQFVGKPDQQQQPEDAGNAPAAFNPDERDTTEIPKVHHKVFWLFGPDQEGESTLSAVKNFVFLLIVVLLAAWGVYYWRREK